MNFSKYKYLILSDLYRITGKVSLIILLRYILIGGSYKYTFWMRTVRYTHNNKLMKLFLYPLARVFLNHYSYKFGILIPYDTKIDSGFYIGHWSGIIVNRHCIIGKNCNISQGVTLGRANRGKNTGGAPMLGNNVYIGPGAKIVGHVKIGDNVAIGANCVVTKDMPSNSVVVGIPGKVISKNGSMGYINRVEYDNILKSYQI